MPSDRGDFASFYVRSARSPKRIFLPRRHALKGLGAAVTVAVLVVAAATGLSRINVSAITAATDSAPAPKAEGGHTVKRAPGAAQPAAPAKPAAASPSASKKPKKPAPHKRPAAPRTTGPGQTPAAPPPVAARPDPPKPQRAQLFTTEPRKGLVTPGFSLAEVWVTTTEPVSDLRLAIRVAQTGGVSNLRASAVNHTSSNDPIPETEMTTTVSQTSGALVYEFTLNDGVTLQPGTYQLAANYSYPDAGYSRYTGGDTYTVSGKNPASGAVDSEKGDFQ